MKDNNFNNVSGNTFNRPTQIIAGNQNDKDFGSEKRAIYTHEPVWRSPITMAIITWISFLLL